MSLHTDPPHSVICFYIPMEFSLPHSLHFNTILACPLPPFNGAFSCFKITVTNVKNPLTRTPTGHIPADCELTCRDKYALHVIVLSRLSVPSFIQKMLKEDSFTNFVHPTYVTNTHPINEQSNQLAVMMACMDPSNFVCQGLINEHANAL